MLVGIVMGSGNDWKTMKQAAITLRSLDIPWEAKVVSAHRTPDLMFEYAERAKARGVTAIIAGAGGSAHLPGMLASKTSVPVLAVPIESKLFGIDSLLSMVQMPMGVPLATFPIGGSVNAALFAAKMFAMNDPELGERLRAYFEAQADLSSNAELELDYDHE